jgi:hypothetical protein
VRIPATPGGIQFHQNRFDDGLQSPQMQRRLKSRRAEPGCATVTARGATSSSWRRSPTEWVDRVRDRGYRHSRFMAAGMDGLVFRLGDGLVAKVWSTKPQRDVERLRVFYSELAPSALRHTRDS